MLKQLNSPYPAPRADRSSVIAGVFMGLFVGVFLVYFQPFGLNGGRFGENTWLVACFGLITGFVYLLLEVVCPLLAPALFRDKDWRVWHRIVYFIGLMLLIATLNGLYINWVQNLPFSWRNYGQIMRQTISLGGLAIVLLVLYQHNAKMVKHLKEANEMQGARMQVRGKVEEQGAATGPILLAAEAYGNYVKCYYTDGIGYRQETDRTTLQALTNARGGEGFIRCHRSYAVALGQVRNVSGNAQGLKLQVGDGGLEIPVSRTYLGGVRKALGEG